MKKIVFMLGNYTPKLSANGMCVKALIDELKNDNEIYVICYGDDYREFCEDNVKFYTIPSNRCLTNKFYSGKVGGLKRKFFLLKTCFVEPPYPISGFEMAKRYYRRLNEILSLEPIDIVVSVVHPVDSAIALMNVKDKTVKKIVYELDALVDDKYLKTGWRKFFLRRNVKLEADIHKNADMVLFLKSHQNYISTIANENKFIPVDIPLINEHYYNAIRSNLKISVAEKDIPTIVYAGSLSSCVRSPEYILRLLYELYNRKTKFNAVFYSRGCSEQISLYSQKTEGMIERKDYVSSSKLIDVYGNADFLLNIGNLAPETLPSKLVQYISTGKPIIHISYSKPDICVDYLNNYPNCVIVNVDDDFYDNVEKLHTFIRNNQNKLLEYANIVSDFSDNTAIWTVRQILSEKISYV